jgi:hypothetical protein
LEFTEQRQGTAAFLGHTDRYAGDRLAPFQDAAGDRDARDESKHLRIGTDRQFLELARGHEARGHLNIQGESWFRDAQAKLALVVGDAQLIEALQTAELPGLPLAESQRLDDGAPYRLAILVEDPAFEDEGRIAPIQIMVLERERHGRRFGVHRRWAERGGIALRDNQQAKKQVRVEILEGKLPLPIRDSAFGAVRIARGSEYADTLTRGRGANEPGRVGQRPARSVPHCAGKVKRLR